MFCFSVQFASQWLIYFRAHSDLIFSQPLLHSPAAVPARGVCLQEQPLHPRALEMWRGQRLSGQQRRGPRTLPWVYWRHRHGYVATHRKTKLYLKVLANTKWQSIHKSFHNVSLSMQCNVPSIFFLNFHSKWPSYCYFVEKQKTCKKKSYFL